MASSKMADSARETIRQIVERGRRACRAQAALSDEPEDDGEWNRLAAIVRSSLKRAADRQSSTTDDMLAKAMLLALVIENEGGEDREDQRYKLSCSLLDDMERFEEETGIAPKPSLV